MQQDQVVDDGVYQPHHQEVSGRRAGILAQQRQSALPPVDQQQCQGGEANRVSQQLQHIQFAQGQLERGRHRRPEQYRGEPVHQRLAIRVSLCPNCLSHNLISDPIFPGMLRDRRGVVSSGTDKVQPPCTARGF